MDWTTILTSIITSVAVSALTAWGVFAFMVGISKARFDNLQNANLPEVVKTHEIKLAVLDEFKNNTTNILDSKLFKAKSPLSLTEEGHKLLSDSGFKTIFENVKDDLIKRFFEEINPKTQYDTQERARQWMDDLSRKEYEPFIPIKSYAFKTGADYAQILRAGSIPLRDYYLERHPEIKD